MNQKKLSIRPVLQISSIIPEENFQNKTLRPILKLQNDIIVPFFIAFCKKQKTSIDSFRKEDFFNNVFTFIKKNTVLRNQLIGLVLGQFTTEELAMYLEKDTAFNKRILQMVAQRIVDNLKTTKTNNK